MILAEDLLLLLLDDESGDLMASSQIGVALGGAVLADLAIGGYATVPDKSGWLDQPKVRATTPESGPPAHPLLAEAVTVVAEKPRTPKALAERLGKHLKERVATELVARGILVEQHDRALGLFPRTRWPTADATHEASVRRAMAAALADGRLTDPRIGALIALTSALGVADRVVDVPGLSRREVRKRAKAVVEGDWAAAGVRDAIAATNAAIVAAVAASTIATTT